ncbi:MAG: hypothetical protein EBW21_05225, partial [Actinobacteria bacterium]|nr:hypothetical protein [Actinomycetota bacterium]
NDAKNLFEILKLEVANRRLQQYGIKLQEIEDIFTSVTKKEIDFGNNIDRSNYYSIADYLVNKKTEQRSLEVLSYAGGGTGRKDVILPDGTIISGDVVTQTIRKSLDVDNIPSGERFFITDSSDGSTPSFIISISQDGTINRHASKLTVNDLGLVKVEFEVAKSSDYKTSNIKTAADIDDALDKVRTAVEAEYKKLKEAEKKVKQDKIKIEAEKSKEVQEIFEDIGKLPTRKVLSKHFGLTSQEASAASIMMDVLGLDVEGMVLKVIRANKEKQAKFKEIGAKASIEWRSIKSGVIALIRSTQESDFGSLAHEMGHYNRMLFIGNTDEHKAFRHKLGITDEVWDKFSDWVGYKGVWESEVSKMSKEQRIAEEKFANAWAFYIRSIMFGDGKSKHTSLHRLFSALGDHLGELGNKMSSQTELEKGLIFTDEAKQVFYKLFLRSESNITKFWESALTGVFKGLPIEERNKIGEHILGTELWNSWKATQEVESTKTTSVIKNIGAITATVKKQPLSELINSVRGKASGETFTPTRKAIKLALNSKLSIDEVKAQVTEIRTKLNSITTDNQFTPHPNRPEASDSYFSSHVKDLTDQEVQKLTINSILKPMNGVISWFFNEDTKSIDVGFPIVRVTQERINKELLRRKLSKAAKERYLEAKAKLEEAKAKVAEASKKVEESTKPKALPEVEKVITRIEESTPETITTVIAREEPSVVVEALSHIVARTDNTPEQPATMITEIVGSTVNTESVTDKLATDVGVANKEELMSSIITRAEEIREEYNIAEVPKELINKFKEFMSRSDKNKEVAPILHKMCKKIEELPDRILMYVDDGEA